MNKINSLTKIKSLYPDITNSEKNIAEFILNNPEEIYNLTIKELAQKTNVTIPTVFRFAQRLGFNGFKDFKVELIKDISVGFRFASNYVS
jgi:DNA-binding MurR/RpiR family transcriptional regulator